MQPVTTHKSSFLVIESLMNLYGDRYPVKQGERRTIRYGYADASFVPEIVKQVRSKLPINWGGAVVDEQYYKVLFDGTGPLPVELR